MELYNILSILETFEHWNWTVLIMIYQRVKRCYVHGHIGKLYKHKINIILFVLLSKAGVSWPKELSNDVMPHPKETSSLKVNNMRANITYPSSWAYLCVKARRSAARPLPSQTTMGTGGLSVIHSRTVRIVLVPPSSIKHTTGVL